MLGRQDFQKGFDLAVRAAAKVSQEIHIINKRVKQYEVYESPLILLCGSSSDPKKVAELAQIKRDLGEVGKRVVIIDDWIGGHIKTMLSAVPHWGLTPSRFEPWGIVDIENYAKTVPSIAPYVGGFVDRLEGRNIGLLVRNFIPNSDTVEKDEKNAELLKNTLMDALTMLRNRPEEHLKMRIAAGESDFSWHTPGPKDKTPTQNYIEAMNIKLSPQQQVA